MNEANMIEATVHRLFENEVDAKLIQSVENGKFPESFWKKITESAFHLALVSEDHGGFGLKWEDGIYPLLFEAGYWNAPIPLAESIISSKLLAANGVDLGEKPSTVYRVGSSTLQIKADTDGSLVLNGKIRNVPWASASEYLLIETDDGQLLRLNLSADQVTIVPGSDYAQMPLDTIVLTGALIPRDAILASLGSAVAAQTQGALAYSIMIAGSLQRALELTVQYANDRKQFGKPLLANQAIQQQLAVFASDLTACKVATLVAAKDMDSGDADKALFSAAVAKIRCSEAAYKCAAIAHQVHGAIGFTYEYSLNYNTRRLNAWRERFGSDAYWAKRLGQLAIAAGSQAFWPAVTERKFPKPQAR